MKLQVLIIFLLIITQTVHYSSANVTVDGIIGVSEYSHSKIYDDVFALYWQLTDNIVYFGIRVNTSGFVSLGFNPTYILKNADIVYGVINASGTFAADTYSEHIFGPPQLDTELGGTNDILTYAGSESNSTTTFEFCRYVDTGDKYDNILNNEVKIIWSFSLTDDYKTMPSTKGSASILLSNISSSITTTTPFIGIIALTTAFCSLVLMRKKYVFSQNRF